MDALTLDDDRFAAQLRGFGPVGIIAILAILFGNAIVIIRVLDELLVFCRDVLGHRESPRSDFR